MRLHLGEKYQNLTYYRKKVFSVQLQAAVQTRATAV